MAFEDRDIKCNVYRDVEAVIRKTELKLKESRNFKERGYYAQDILLEVKTLLSCPNCNVGNPDCANCHSISQTYIRGYEYLTKNKNRKFIYK